VVLQSLRRGEPAKRDIVLAMREKKMTEDRVVAIATATFWVALMLSAAVMNAGGIP